MPEIDIYKYLKESHDVSSINDNEFKRAINSLPWEKVFEEDGETYFCAKGGLTLVIDNINPCREKAKPSVIFPDGSMVTFGVWGLIAE